MGATDYVIESGARCPAAKASERAIFGLLVFA